MHITNSSSPRQLTLLPINLARPSQLAEVFTSEAEWRTTLLQAPGLLDESVGGRVENLEEEPTAAGYRADLAFTSGGRNVLLELQLGVGDSRHLGQVVRYAGLGDADLVLWLADEIHAHDTTLLDAINQVAGCKVLAVSVHALLTQAGHVLFPRLVAGSQYQVGRGFGDAPASPRELSYEAFWRLMLAELAAQRSEVFRDHNPSRQKSIRASLIQGSGVYARVSLAADVVRVAVQVDFGDEVYNGGLWDELVENQAALEGALGGEIELRAPGRTGVLETLVVGGYAVNPERAARETAKLLGSVHGVVVEVLEDAGWRELQASCRRAPSLF